MQLRNILIILLSSFRYDVHLSDAAKFGVDKGFGMGVGMAIFQVVMLANYGLSLWWVFVFGTYIFKTMC